jgi:ATP/maltotriose-dependent transcriptional regulator MalT
VTAIQSIREATALAQVAGNISSTILYISRTAYSLLLHGKLHEVVQEAERAALLGRTPFGLPHAMVFSAYIFHAEVLREWNRLDEALVLVLQAVRLSEHTETIVTLFIGYTELMRVYLARGEMEAARSAFQHAEEVLVKTYSPYRRDVYVIVEWVKFWLASGELDRATHWAEELAQQPRLPSTLARERQNVAQTRILLTQKRFAEALSLLEPRNEGLAGSGLSDESARARGTECTFSSPEAGRTRGLYPLLRGRRSPHGCPAFQAPGTGAKARTYPLPGHSAGCLCKLPNQ